MPTFSYSLLWVAALLIALVGFVLLRNNPRTVDVLAFAGIVLGLVAVYYVIRPVQTVFMDEAAEIQAMIGVGEPVLLEFQSPY